MSEKLPLEIRFREFHMANPNVFHELVELAWQAHYAGKRRIGIGQLFEVLRWNVMVRTKGQEGFKLNNDLRAVYAREIMRTNPALGPIFETRRSCVDEAR